MDVTLSFMIEDGNKTQDVCKLYQLSNIYVCNINSRTLIPRSIGEALTETEERRAATVLWIAIFDNGCSPANALPLSLPSLRIFMTEEEEEEETKISRKSIAKSFIFVAWRALVDLIFIFGE